MDVNMTKIWTQSYEPTQLTDARILDDTSANLEVYMAVMSCESMAGRFPKTTVEILSAYPPADYFEIGGMFIVSEQLKSVFEEFKVHAEFFELQIVSNSLTTTVNSFYFCNILDSIRGFDLKRGKYTYSKTPGFSDYIKAVKNLAINEAVVAPFHLFRMDRCSPNIICSSEALANRIVDLKLTGMIFVEPSKYRSCI
jgi:hypothetical protein